MVCSPESLKKLSNAANAEIGESNVDIREMKNNLRNLVSIRYPKLKLPPDELNGDKFLEMCLRARKFNLDRATEQVHKFFKYMQNVNADKLFLPSLHEDIFETYGMTVLKERDALGRRIIFWDFEKFPSDTFDMDEILAALMLLKFELLRLSVDTQRIGIAYVVNLQVYDLTHAKKIAARLRACVKMITGNLPVRIKDFHLVNSGTIFRYTVELFKPFLGRKIFNRLHVYGTDLSAMYKTVSPDMLPMCVGGSVSIEKSADREFMRNLILQEEFYKEFFKWGYALSTESDN